MDIIDKLKDEKMKSFVNTVVGTARTEHVQEMNGNPVKNRGKTAGQYRDYKMYLGEEEVEINPGSFVSPYAYKYVVRLDEKPVFWDQVLDLDPMLRATKGLYMIKYTPRGSKDYRKGRPFKIGQDLIRWDIRVSGTREWAELCERIPELRWLSRNSTLTENMFKLAVRHPGMSFWFSIKWDEYEAKLQAQSESVLEKAFVSRKCSVANYKDKYKENDKSVLIRYFNDVLKEVNEAEALPAVQDEMRSEAGEGYDRSRKLERDPITGQFIKKEKM